MSDAFTDTAFHRDRPTVTGPVMCHFRVPERDWIASRLDHIGWREGLRVLDAGCGPGAYVAGTRARIGSTGTLIALDVGLTRLQDVPGHAACVQGDVTTLPFAAGSFDVALAMHMLYHVPDIPAAVRELRRAVTDDGVLVVSTNAPGALDEPQVTELFLRCGGTSAEAFGDINFNLDNGAEYLGAAFGEVEVHEELSQFVVPAVEPILNSFESMRYTLEPFLESGLGWDEFMRRLQAESERILAAHGNFVVDCHSVVFVCRL